MRTEAYIYIHTYLSKASVKVIKNALMHKDHKDYIYVLLTCLACHEMASLSLLASTPSFPLLSAPSSPQSYESFSTSYPCLLTLSPPLAFSVPPAPSAKVSLPLYHLASLFSSLPFTNITRDRFLYSLKISD